MTSQVRIALTPSIDRIGSTTSRTSASGEGATAASTAFVLAACLIFGEYVSGQVVHRVVHAKDYLMPVFEKPFSKLRDGKAERDAKAGEGNSYVDR